MARLLITAALLVSQADAKGGYSSGYSGGGYSGGYSYSGGYYNSGGVVTNRAAFASAGLFAGVILVSAGSRRRYGVWHDEADESQCLLATEEEMQSACSNLMTDQAKCHDCIACETETCMNGITNCDEFLATVWTECCTEDCEGGSVVGAIVGIVVTALFCVCGALIAFKVLNGMRAGSSVQDTAGGSPVPYGSSPYGGSPSPYGSSTPYGANTNPYLAGPVSAPGQVVTGQVVQGQVLGVNGGMKA